MPTWTDLIETSLPRDKLREHPRLEVELELAAHGRTEAVEKLAELRACDVILHISGVEVVSGVKNGDAESRSSSCNPGDDVWYSKDRKSTRLNSSHLVIS